MYQLYNRKGSGGFVVEAALALADAPFELINLDSQSGTPLPESFKTTNPWGQVPTLILPDGSTMTETAAILIYLNTCYPDKALGPAPSTSDYAMFLRWLVFANVNIYETVLRTVYPFRYTADPDAVDATRAAAGKRVGEAFKVLETAIAPGPFLFGETMCIADVYFAMLFVWCQDKVQALRLNALKDKVKQHPTVATIWRNHYGER